MTAATVVVRPLEEHVDAMASAENLFALVAAYGEAVTDGYSGVTVADLLCGSPQEPVLFTVEQLFKHLHRDLMRNGAQHVGLVAPASREDGGRGPALGLGPR